MFQTVYSPIKQGLGLIWMVVLLACTPESQKSPLPYYNTPDFTPIFVNEDLKQDVVDHTIGDFNFTNQHGREVSASDISGKIHVANFIFTSCGSICPIMTNQMKRVQDAFGNDEDVVILSYTVTPWIDDVERLNTYASLNDVTSPNWHLLTGNKAAIYDLARRSYFAEEDLGFTKDSTDFLHTEHVLLVDASRRIRGIYNGTLGLETEQMILDIQQLQQE